MESLKANDDIKMALLISMQQTMQKLVDKLWVAIEWVVGGYLTSIGNVCATHAFVFVIHKLLAMPPLLAHNYLDLLPPVFIEI